MLVIALVADAHSATIEVGSASVPAGASFSVPLVVDSGTNALGAYVAFLRFDGSVLQWHAVAGGDAQFASPPFAVSRSNGVVNVLGSNALSLSSPTGVTQVAHIIFTAIGSVGTTSAVEFLSAEVLDTNGRSLPVTAINGEVVIEPSDFFCHYMTISANSQCEGMVSPSQICSAVDPNTGPTTCSLEPPGPYPLGTTVVTLTVVDGQGNTHTCMFAITVVDDTPPSVVGPGPITTVADAGQCTVTVTYDVPTASDNCPRTRVECVPASGSRFRVGTMNVSCLATDVGGNMVPWIFSVTVIDNEPPSLSCRDILTNVPIGQTSAVVSYLTPVGSDNCPGTTVACSPTAGSVFETGISPVICVATDTSGNSMECTFTVTVAATECVFAIEPSGASFGREGDRGSIAVTAAEGCNWTAVSNDRFITVISGGSGSGNGTVIYDVADNFGTESRTGTITIADQIFTVTQSGPPPEADLVITQVDSPDPVVVGSNLTYTITVRNAGPHTATGILLVDQLPSPISSVLVQSDGAHCTNADNVTLSCDLDDLDRGESATITIELIPTTAGVLTNSAYVTAVEFDFQPNNNRTTESTLVVSDGIPTPTIEDLVRHLELLDLSRGQSHSLIRKAEKAGELLMAGKRQAAINILHALINQLMHFKTTGVLEPAEIDNVVDLTESIIHDIEASREG